MRARSSADRRAGMTRSQSGNPAAASAANATDIFDGDTLWVERTENPNLSCMLGVWYTRRGNSAFKMYTYVKERFDWTGIYDVLYTSSRIYVFYYV